MKTKINNDNVEQENIKKEIRFIPCKFTDLETKDNRFYFLAEKDIEWKAKKVRQFSLPLKISRELLRENFFRKEVVVIHNPWLVNEIPSAEDEKSWKCLDIGYYDNENNEIIYGYDDLIFEELTWKDGDKKKILVGGGAIVAFFVAVVLVFRRIYQKKKKKQ